jgi:BirA family biotin operon repressor/biotin-[acetyl-CoA-carboxylase] ligase
MENPASYLANLPIGDVRYYPCIGSTNDEAMRWIEAGATDLSVVIANEQTSGRGRFNRRWYTPPDSALAFSIILRQVGQGLPQVSQNIPRLTALGALAVCDSLASLYQLEARIKWPNDILIDGRKFGGILVEAQWLGEQLEAVIMGIGIDITPVSIPDTIELNFPATCLEDCLATRQQGSKPIDRWVLLRNILEKILHWRPLLHSILFTRAWDERLAFRNEWVRVDLDYETNSEQEQPTCLEGKLLGITASGALQLLDRAGKLITVQAGEIHEVGKIHKVGVVHEVGEIHLRPRAST